MTAIRRIPMSRSVRSAASRSRAPSLEGILAIVKPVGMTSHDVVDYLRRLTRTRRIGHTGTLDPGATGVLVLCIGRATRVAEFLAEADKEYWVEMTVGRSTDSGDAYGAVIRETAVESLTREEVEAVLPRFLGEIDQVPPMASAVHVGGERLYDLARRGKTVEVAPRRVTIFAIELLEVLSTPPRVRLSITCSKGTYIRRLCHDLGEALGYGAHATFMIRTRVGRYALASALTLEEIAALASAEHLGEVLDSLDVALGELPAVDLAPGQHHAVIHGQPLPLFKVAHWKELLGARAVRVRDAKGLIALARVEAGVLKPFKVLRNGG